MTPEEIREGNRLIAEFMGGEIRKGKKVEVVMMDSADGPFVAERVSNLKYDTSWDWLMPVVGKIGQMDEEWLIENRCPEIEAVMQLTIFAPIATVFEKIVQFIKWHNQQKGG